MKDQKEKFAAQSVSRRQVSRPSTSAYSARTKPSGHRPQAAQYSSEPMNATSAASGLSPQRNCLTHWATSHGAGQRCR